MKYQFTQKEIKDYQNNGYLVSRNFFKKKDIQNLIKWTDEIEKLKETKGKWMKYYDPSLKDKKKVVIAPPIEDDDDEQEDDNNEEQEEEQEEQEEQEEEEEEEEEEIN